MSNNVTTEAIACAIHTFRTVCIITTVLHVFGFAIYCSLILLTTYGIIRTFDSLYSMVVTGSTENVEFVKRDDMLVTPTTPIDSVEHEHID
jgi:hypothetical protein